MSTISSSPDAGYGDTVSRDEFVAASPTQARSSGATSRNALAGGAAALVASAVMLWAGRSWDGVILAQLISERATDIVPLAVFREGLEALESDAKPLTLAGLTLLQVVLGAIAGVIYGRFARHGLRNRLTGFYALAGLTWLGLSIIAAPLGDIGLLAREATGGMWRTQATFITAALIFGALAAALIPWTAPRPAVINDEGAPENPSRRQLLRRATVAGIAVPALASGWYVGDFVRDLRRKQPGFAVIDTAPNEPFRPFAFKGMPPRITPTPQFYVVSKNFIDPTVDSGDWTLSVMGMVERELSLSYTDIANRPSSNFDATLCCISNQIGGKYISNATWTGFPLHQLLEEAGLPPGVVDIQLQAADGYIESIPLAEALAPDTMLVHSINGEPLPDSHGAPLRLIVPGIFGMKNVKWITRIAPMDSDIQGYWQERGWSDIATVVTMSRIDVPKGGTKWKLNQPVTIGGVAFAGDRGIQRVELSFDGGVTWTDAELDAASSQLSWRLWQHHYTPTKLGELFITVRATDGAGEVQTDDTRPTLPDGATGHHSIKVKVQE